MYITVLPLDSILLDVVYESGEYSLVTIDSFYGIAKDKKIIYITDSKVLGLLTLYELGLRKPLSIRKSMDFVFLKISREDVFNNGEIIVKKVDKSLKLISQNELNYTTPIIYEWKQNCAIFTDDENKISYMLSFNSCYKKSNSGEIEVYECINDFGKFYVAVDIINCIISQSISILNKISELAFGVRFLK
ncbi:hypothetical protein [Sulfurisphaera tokodaii]|uniref:Uncharacterized protein n=2 Tax=Sulfurisphaera tokodaii TaxID=111955 RepID=Q974D9_SULTO|nr:hypothetical protein [Sulfurisphaera tokodaii]BAB65720.1 hypothetical protein STK_07120 [Sulfurisphaera tokodaii str. 7]HII74503.1 hypothetical protein [Sulfurisphaera tokodaii]